MQLSDAERQTLAEIGAKLGKQALEDVATIVQPDTILGWNRKLAADKFDGSTQRKPLGLSVPEIHPSASLCCSLLRNVGALPFVVSLQAER